MVPERYGYDWTVKYPHTMALGRLMTCYRTHILPGDQMSVSTEFFVRMRDFRFFQLSDIRFDVFWFWEPLRDYYEGKEIATQGGRWAQFVLDQGRSSASSLSNYLFPAPSVRYSYLRWFGGQMRHDIPWIYDRFYEHFIRPEDENSERLYSRANAPYVKRYPLTGRDVGDSLSSTPTLPTDDYTRKYGRKVPKPPGLWGPDTLRQFKLGVDPELAVPVVSGSAVNAMGNATNGVTINLSDLGFAGNRALRQTAQQVGNRRARVDTFLQSVYGSAPRDITVAFPILLDHSTFTARIMDVMGTAGDEHGRKISVGVSSFGSSFPDYFFPEHGVLYCCAMMRPDTFYPDQVDDRDWRIGYGELLADPVVFGQGEDQVPKTWINGQSSRASEYVGWIPHHEQWRQEANFFHPDFDKNRNNQFGLESQHGDDWAEYIDSDTPNNYNGWFREGERFGHAIVKTQTNVSALRIIPPADRSVFQDIQLRGGMSDHIMPRSRR